jgi:hypothetical protein
LTGRPGDARMSERKTSPEQLRELAKRLAALVPEYPDSDTWEGTDFDDEQSPLGAADITDISKAAAGYKPHLTPVTEEWVKGLLIRLANKKIEVINRHFPEIAKNKHVVTYEHVEHMTHDQAEFIANELASQVRSFIQFEQKVRKEAPMFGRTGLLPTDKAEKEDLLKDVGSKRKAGERALVNFCGFYGLENPLS